MRTDYKLPTVMISEVLGALGRNITAQEQWLFSSAELFVTQASNYVSKVHLAFQAQDREAVNRFYQAGITAGGKGHGAPGQRPYHAGYYSAYILDPDGNNIEAVYHGEASRSANSIIITIVPHAEHAKTTINPQEGLDNELCGSLKSKISRCNERKGP